MAKYDGVIGQRILAVTETPTELTVVIEDNRYLFVTIQDGKLSVESVPE